VGGDLTIYLPGDPLAGYLSVPLEGGPWPGVVVLHQAFGLDADMRRITDRVAHMGYLAVAPDLLAAGRLKCLARLFRDVQRGRGESVDRLLTLVDWLKARADCSGRVGVIGFCLGGSLAFLLGCSGSLQAAAPNYGKAPRGDLLALTCPVVASYGGRDRVFRKEAVKIGDQLVGRRIVHDVKLYPNVGHAFMNQTDYHGPLAALMGPLMAIGYNREAAEDAWRRIEDFFDRFLQ
jgi:carboxymethylenebutenolidase